MFIRRKLLDCQSKTVFSLTRTFRLHNPLTSKSSAMKFFVATLVASVVLISQVLASPTPGNTPDTTFHCGGENNLSCPSGYRCCGPISVENGGTCYQGTRGICPL
ncbi:hypothetical protein D9613_006575 [Agrocybe pediades]|uniref:Uncharacterized protein n=1 Tax=Agrocybe pediades TaxID=84607 RepID=A0A8H4VIA2_9AGAR|nr:hypothetical protein D9613_006575 [Agrocybe pediades]